MTGYPPSPYQPPPGHPTAPVQPPAIAWLIPAGGLATLVAAFLLWFDPTATHGGTRLVGTGARYTWQQGLAGTAPPFVVVVISIVWILLARGTARRRVGAPNPVRALGLITAGLGAVSLIAIAGAWFWVSSESRSAPAPAR